MPVDMVLTMSMESLSITMNPMRTRKKKRPKRRAKEETRRTARALRNQKTMSRSPSRRQKCVPRCQRSESAHAALQKSNNPKAAKSAEEKGQDAPEKDDESKEGGDEGAEVSDKDVAASLAQAEVRPGFLQHLPKTLTILGPIESCCSQTSEGHGGEIG